MACSAPVDALFLPIQKKTIVNKLLGIIQQTDLVPKCVHENRTKGVENEVDDTLKLVVFLECAQC